MASIKVFDPVSVPLCVLEELQQLRAQVEQLRRENERLRRENERLQRELNEARTSLDQAQRQSKLGFCKQPDAAGKMGKRRPFSASYAPAQLVSRGI